MNRIPIDHRWPAGKAPSLEYLCSQWDVDFVRSAYLTILRRYPDGEGEENYVRQIRAGVPKLEILRALARSKEGRAIGARLPGLDCALWRYEIIRLPILMRICDRLGLPTTMSHAARLRRKDRNAVYRLSREIEFLWSYTAELSSRLDDTCRSPELSDSRHFDVEPRSPSA